MKKLILIQATILAFLFVSCDKVKDPIEKKTTTVAVGSKFITKTNSTVSNSKKALVEDYTGAYCGNCPPAAVVAHSLETQYTPNVVVIAVHAGFYAIKHLPEYPGTYTTAVGDAWNDSGTGFGVGAIGNPNGMVNRKIFPGNNLVQSHTKWPTSVSLALQEPMIVKLDVTTNYDTTARALNTDVKATFKATYTNNINVCLVLTEDGIVGHQKDYTKNPDLVEDYDFERMLRADINGPWGSSLKNTPIAANDSVKVSFPNFSMNANFNDKNISVVVMAYDAISKEVIQVEKVKIR